MKKKTNATWVSVLFAIYYNWCIFLFLARKTLVWLSINQFIAPVKVEKILAIFTKLGDGENHDLTENLPGIMDGLKKFLLHLGYRLKQKEPKYWFHKQDRSTLYSFCWL